MTLNPIKTVLSVIVVGSSIAVWAATDSQQDDSDRNISKTVKSAARGVVHAKMLVPGEKKESVKPAKEASKAKKAVAPVAEVKDYTKAFEHGSHHGNVHVGSWLDDLFRHCHGAGKRILKVIGGGIVAILIALGFRKKEDK